MKWFVCYLCEVSVFLIESLYWFVLGKYSLKCGKNVAINILGDVRVEASLPHRLPLLGGVVVEVVLAADWLHVVPGPVVVDPWVRFEP